MKWILILFLSVTLETQSWEVQYSPDGSPILFRETEIRVSVLGGKKVRTAALAACQRVTEVVPRIKFVFVPLDYRTHVVFRAKGQKLMLTPGSCDVYIDYNRSSVIKASVIVGDLKRLNFAFTRLLLFGLGMAGSDDSGSILYWRPDYWRGPELGKDDIEGLNALYGSD